MYWKISCDRDGGFPDSGESDGRFVLHRHYDTGGAHLDLRIEQEGFLLGWRIEGTSLETKPWATTKAPHPMTWLERDGDAVREDAGTYAWVERGRDRAVLLLRGRIGMQRICLEREEGLPANVVRTVRDALTACGAEIEAAARLIADGAAARTRAIERLCGLGRELDNTTFEEGVWRRALSGLSLEEIHAQLRAFEVRFDAKYPPQPVSHQERLPELESEEGGNGMRVVSARAIARD